MARCFKRFFWGLALLALVSVNLTPDCAAFTADEATSAAKQKAAGAIGEQPIKLLSKDLYNFFIRNGLAPKVKRGLLRTGQNISHSAFLKLAHAWHSLFVHRLKTAKIPESWKTVAVGLHKELGGQGDLLASLEDRSFTFNRVFLRDEFISYAVFFLNALVPEQISDCFPKPDKVVTKCIAQYEKSLQAALVSTLISFFHFAISRTSASHILTRVFVFAAGSPCPFAYLTEPVFVYGALLGSDIELLMPLSSAKRAASAKQCPELKMMLLRALMVNGVTPADMMKAKNMKEGLSKIPDSKSRAIMEERESIVGISKFDLEELKDADKATAKAILEIQEKDTAETRGLEMTDLIKELSDALNAETQEAPQHVPLYPVKVESTDDVANTVLDRIRSFSFQGAHFLQPKEEGDKK